MLILNELSEIQNLKAVPSVILIGKFDGLHIGHRALFQKMQKHKAKGLRAVVVTFHPMPEEFLFNKKVPLIMSRTKKLEAFARMGADVLAELPANRETLDFSAQYFLKDVLIDCFGLRVIVAGEDVAFGKGKTGNAQYLLDNKELWGFETDIAKEILVPCPDEKYLKYSGKTVSSTLIRDMITDGDISLANALMESTFSITGNVVSGRQLGRTIGFPTINILPEADKVIPKNGVYFTRLSAAKGTGFIPYNGVSNLGLRPTVSKTKDRIIIETHILDEGFDGTVDFDECQVEFLEFVRPEKHFNGIDELKAAIASDVSAAIKYFPRP